MEIHVSYTAFEWRRLYSYTYICFYYVYAFLYSDAFKFGYMKFTDIIISQGLSIIILNCITYFQICLIANNMISFFPIILMTVIDIAVRSVFIIVKFYCNIS